MVGYEMLAMPQRDITPETARQLSLPNTRGVLLEEVRRFDCATLYVLKRHPGTARTGD